MNPKEKEDYTFWRVRIPAHQEITLHNGTKIRNESHRSTRLTIHSKIESAQEKSNETRNK